MKAKDIVAKIAESSEYDRLVKLWSSENGNEEHLSSEILKIVQALSERIKGEKISFLFSSGLKRRSNLSIIDFRVPQHVQDAKEKFDRELNIQMPVFIQLMNLIPVENLIPGLISISIAI